MKMFLIALGFVAAFSSVESADACARGVPGSRCLPTEVRDEMLRKVCAKSTLDHVASRTAYALDGSEEAVLVETGDAAVKSCRMYLETQSTYADLAQMLKSGDAACRANLDGVSAAYVPTCQGKVLDVVAQILGF